MTGVALPDTRVPVLPNAKVPTPPITLDTCDGERV